MYCTAERPLLENAVCAVLISEVMITLRACDLFAMLKMTGAKTWKDECTQATKNPLVWIGECNIRNVSVTYD